MDALTILLKAKDEASKVFDKVKGSMKSLAKNGATAVKAGFQSVVNILPIVGAGVSGLGGLMLKFASDSQETRNRFDAVFGDMKDTANDFVDSLANDTGRATTEIRNGMSAFQGMATGLGFAKDEAFNFSTELQTLAIDFASFNNLSDGEAQERFIAAMSGSSEVLDQFGVNIREGALDQKLLERGFPTIAKGATEAQKAIARLDIIKETMGRQGAIGDAIKTGNDFANLLRRGRSLLINYAEAIGSRLIPVGENLLRWVFKVAPSTDTLNGYLDKAQSLFEKIAKKLQPVIDKFKEFDQGGEILRSILAGLAGTGLVLLIGGLATLAVSVLAVAWPFILLAGVIAALWYAWETNFGGIQEKTAVVFDYIKQAFSYFQQEILPVLLEKLQQFANWFGETAVPAIEDFINTAWKNLETAFNFFNTYILPALIETFNYVKETVMTKLVPALQELWGSLQELWDLISPYILPILAVLAVIITSLVISAIILFTESIVFLSRIAKIAVDLIIGLFKSLEKIVKGVIDVIAGIIEGDWDRVMSGFKEIGSGAVDFVKSLFDGVKDTISEVVDSIGGAINSAKDLGKSIGGKIPGFAVGTSHFSGGTALVGERGPELVNLPAGSKIETATATKRKMQGQGSNTTINFSPNINFSGMSKPSRSEIEEVFENLKPAFIKYLKQQQVIA